MTTEVYYSSPWVPREWIAAHGLTPRGLWAAPPARLGAVPEGVCPFAQTALCHAQNQTGAAFIFTTVCDQMRRAFDEADAGQAAHTFLFNIPATWQTPAARRLFRAELERLGRFLVGLGGRVPSGLALAEAMRRHDAACAQLLGLAAAAGARAWAEAVARFHWNGEVGTDPLPGPPGCARVPLAVVGGPMLSAYAGVWDAVEQAGGRVVLNGTDLGERSLEPGPAEADAVADSFDRLADRAFDRMTGVFQRPNSRLYAWLQERLGPRQARGVVLWQFVGCDLWRAEAGSLREAFGLPVLALEADDSPHCTPRETGRLQAFVEMLQ